ncbi:hypothetical protein AB0M54_18115 [Actinoplanes sp. NPDC051470]|uniref:hypothetical protein n=1 Tax=Actinoplanes sp. NPDC051470 TaxID=3157224 RepID=UPI00341FDA81
MALVLLPLGLWLLARAVRGRTADRPPLPRRAVLALGAAVGAIGGYLGAHLQPQIPERALRILLGGLATALAGLYLVQATFLP